MSKRLKALLNKTSGEYIIRSALTIALLIDLSQILSKPPKIKLHKTKMMSHRNAEDVSQGYYKSCKDNVEK